MRGRYLFKFFRPILVSCSVVLDLLPQGFCYWLLSCTRQVQNKLGIGLRYILIKRLCKKCGDNVAVFEGVYLYHLEAVEFGNNISIQPMCTIIGQGGLVIGSDVSIAHASSIITTSHDYSKPELNTRDTEGINEKVIIGDDVWIGAGARILSGVTIGNHCVIGANSVVTHDIPDNTVAVGCPARPIKTIKKSE